MPHCVKLGLWSGLAGFGDNTYSTNEEIERANAEMGAYDTYMQSKMFKAAEMAGVNVKKSLVFLRRPPSQLATDQMGVCMDNGGGMGRTSFKHKYRASGWDVKYGSYGSPESRMSYIVDKETGMADIEQKP